MKTFELYDDTKLRDWLRVCYTEACKSPDASTQLGAAIISERGNLMSLEHNRFPDGWTPTQEDFERPRKYLVTEHAERGAIYKAAKIGLPTSGCTLVSTWAACADCARAIVQAGIQTLVRHTPPSDDAVNRWLERVALGDEIMEKGGVSIINITGPIPNTPSIIRDGKPFHPDLEIRTGGSLLNGKSF